MIFIPNKTIKLTVLTVGAHCDDSEIGAFGFLCRLIREVGAIVHLAVMTGDNRRRQETLNATKYLLGVRGDCLARARVHFGGFRDRALYRAGHGPIRFLERLLAKLQPDLILTHAPGDLHDDHRKTYDATVSAARDFHGTMMLYESPSTKPNEFLANFFVELGDEELRIKIGALRKHVSQRSRPFMSDEQVRRMAQTWSIFHRLRQNCRVEAFKMEKHFWELSQPLFAGGDAIQIHSATGS